MADYKSKVVSIRLDHTDYADLITLIDVGIFDSKTDALRRIITTALFHYRDNIDDLVSYYCAMRTFDDDYADLVKDAAGRAALTDYIDRLRTPFDFDTRYRLERGSEVIVGARIDRDKYRESISDL